MAVASPNIHRCERLIRRAIEDFELSLGELTVLTEAASGPFAVTPFIAALAGAERVLALTRDSPYGSAAEVRELTRELAAAWGVADRVTILPTREDPALAEVDVVTNLGFVRPLDRDMLRRLGPTAAIALMFEPWEHRAADVDLESCRELDIPVLGTNEDDLRLQTFAYLPGIATKLLFDLGVEIHGSRVVLVSAGRFAAEIEAGLRKTGAYVDTFAPPLVAGEAGFESAVSTADAIIIADHPASGLLLGESAAYRGSSLRAINPGLVLAHIAGGIDAAEVAKCGMPYAPGRIAPAGSMSVTAGYLGPKPVIDLHTAGLEVGSRLARMRRGGDSAAKAEKRVLAALPLARGFGEAGR